MSARKNYPYPEDEFDVAGAADGPEGVHRAERSAASKLLPWIMVLVLVPLISFGVVFYLSQNDTDLGDALFGDDERPAPTEPSDEDEPADEDAGEDGEENDAEDATEDDVEDESDEGEPDDADSEDEPEVDEPVAEVNRAARVRVLNATNVAGLAGLGSERVIADGFSQVVPDNYAGGATRVGSAVKYLGDDMLPTAQQVAQVLQIDDVLEDPAAGDEIIVELWEPLD